MKHIKRIFITSLLLVVPLIIFQVSLHAEQSRVEQGKAYYQCSMHPWITSDKPGTCPICGMGLEKVDYSIEITQTKNGKGKILYYQNPMNPKVISQVPAKDEMGMDYVPVYEDGASEVTVPGFSQVNISSEKQQLIGITKEKAEIRPLIYSIHSVGQVAYNPDIATALAEYREALNAYRGGRWNRDTIVKEKSMQVLELAEAKLSLSGISKEQFEQIKNANYDTRVLSNFFAPEGLSLPEGHTWVDTDIYEPAVTILEHLYPKIVKGGICVLDDYSTFPGETKAVDEYFKDQNIKIHKFPFCMTPCYIVKD